MDTPRVIFTMTVAFTAKRTSRDTEARILVNEVQRFNCQRLAAILELINPQLSP